MRSLDWFALCFALPCFAGSALLCFALQGNGAGLGRSGRGRSGTDEAGRTKRDGRSGSVEPSSVDTVLLCACVTVLPDKNSPKHSFPSPNLSKACAKAVQRLSKACPNPVQTLSKPCPNLSKPQMFLSKPRKTTLANARNYHAGASNMSVQLHYL